MCGNHILATQKQKAQMTVSETRVQVVSNGRVRYFRKRVNESLFYFIFFSGRESRKIITANICMDLKKKKERGEGVKRKG